MKTHRQVVLAVMLTAVAVIGRLTLHYLDMPNIETITLAVILAGAFLGGGYAIAVALISIALTDVIVGNDIILVFTWSAWAIIAFFGGVLHRKKWNVTRFTLGATGMGLLANLFFYLWTNAGVWLVGRLYPSTLDGLIASYVAGLPFLRLQLLGNIILLPAASVVFFYVARFVLAPSKMRGAQTFADTID